MKTSKKTTEKPLFTKGGRGGSGRGRSAFKDRLRALEDTIDFVETAARQGVLDATETPDMIRSLKVLLTAAQLQSKKPSDSEPVIPLVQTLTGWLLDLTTGYLERTGESLSPAELIEKLPKLCAGRPRFFADAVEEIDP
ncbi:MAG: hypothetical protein PVF38_05085 [Desulfobacterales bacterium]